VIAVRAEATAGTSMAPYGWEALDFVGAGVGLGAGAGAEVGGASEGAAAREVVPPLAGCVPWVLPPELTGVPAEGVGFATVDAAADGDALAAEDAPFPAAVCPDDCVEAEVVVA
jgi:hypothetical protein